MIAVSTNRDEAIQLARVSSVLPPPRWAEYIYFALVAYAIMAAVWEVAVPFLGAGGMALLAMYNGWRLRRQAKTIYFPLILPVACAVTMIAVQVLVHERPFLESANRESFNWMLALIVVQSLLLREGFLHRFVTAALFIGLLATPYLVFNYGGAQSDRAGLERSIGIANPNDLAAWFGFCCVYCGVVAVETRRNIVRVVASLVGLACLFMVGLTVSRTALVGIVIALIIAARHILKRGFLPLLIMTILTSAAFFSGVFDEAIGLYSQRGMEETGRFLVWPLAVQGFMDSPLTGVGMDNIDIYVPMVGRAFTPHNGFLYIGLASGIVPLALFVAYWIKAARGAYSLDKQGLQSAPFQLPLLVYTFLVVSSGAGAFMFPWAIVTLCNAMPPKASRIIALRLRKGSPESRRAEAKTSYDISGERSYLRP